MGKLTAVTSWQRLPGATLPNRQLFGCLFLLQRESSIFTLSLKLFVCVCVHRVWGEMCTLPPDVSLVTGAISGCGGHLGSDPLMMYKWQNMADGMTCFMDQSKWYKSLPPSVCPTPSSPCPPPRLPPSLYGAIKLMVIFVCLWTQRWLVISLNGHRQPSASGLLVPQLFGG